MRNIETKITGTKLTVTVDLAAPATPSKSGKSQVIASTEGNVKLQTPQGLVSLGVNVYRSAQ